ncbi:Protein of unknown function [Gryllus bimaculatus]|nr:Protein of unknown function [Gryllus bimaculatus]
MDGFHWKHVSALELIFGGSLPRSVAVLSVVCNVAAIPHAYAQTFAFLWTEEKIIIYEFKKIINNIV